MMDKSKVSVTIKTYVDEANLTPNPGWQFVSMSEATSLFFNIPGSDVVVQNTFSMNWAASKFSLVIKRSSAFYVNLFVWPLLFLLLVGTCVFILPPTCVERASMGVLLLITLVRT